MAKKRKDQTAADTPALCNAPRLAGFSASFLTALVGIIDPVQAAATLRQMAPHKDPLRRRQHLSARISLLSMSSLVVALPAPADPVSEPVVVAAEPAPPPPPPEPRKKIVTSLLSLDEATQLFSAFEISDPQAPAATMDVKVSMPDPTNANPPELERIENQRKLTPIERVEAEEKDKDARTAEPPAAKRRKSSRPRPEDQPEAAKKPRKTAELPEEDRESSGQTWDDSAPEKPANAPKPGSPDAQRARRIGESRIINSDPAAAGRPAIDFSGLAAFGSPDEDEAEEKPAFKPGLKVDLSAMSFLSDMSDLSDTDDDDDAADKPADPKP